MDVLNTELAVFIKNEVDHVPTLSADCCIYPVPERLRRMNEAAYRPVVVSIGPIYHKDKTLCFMEKHKLRYLRTFMISSVDIRRRLEDYIQIIREREVAIRGHYMQMLELSSEEFTEMVLVDSVFIIELFRRFNDPTLIEENDPLFGRWQLIDDVWRDLKLLENQLPVFIVEALYNFAFHAPSFSSITCKFFNVRAVEIREFKHFVDLLRTCHLPSLMRSSSDRGADLGVTISVTYLSSGGVKFVPCPEKSLLDIEFDADRRSLKMAPFVLDDLTEPFFRNLLLFEQLHYPLDSYIIDYIIFLVMLVSTTNDVAILVRCGIIKNMLESDEDALKFFNTIGKHIKFVKSRFYYSDVCKKLDKCCNECWNQNIAILKREYLSHPWAVVAVIYAVVILIVSLVQAATGVLSSIRGS